MAGVGVYAVLAIVSIIWAVSGATSNPIGARISAGVAAEGSTFVGLRNQSGAEWTNVIVIADGYYWTTDLIDHRESVAPRLADFASTSFVPRPFGMYAWERVGTLEPTPQFASSDHRPADVAVFCDQGSHSRAVSVE